MTNTAHLMSCTKKGCTRCEPPTDTEKLEKVQEEDDSYRIRTGYKRIGR